MSKVLSLLSQETGLSENDIRRILSNAPQRYKTYHIKKRDGGKREISQPAREVKALQRLFMQLFLEKLPVHYAATAYKPGTSIRKNAETHAKNDVIMKFDFKDFFPSILATDWENYCEKNKIFENQIDIFWSSQLLFRQKTSRSLLRLAIGAPSSPMLSNILMHEFDTKASEQIATTNLIYTRYADDITYSAPRAGFMRNLETELNKLIKATRSPKLKLNQKKTILATKKYKRVITGLVITNDKSVSIGRDKKRLVRAQMHYFKMGKLNQSEIAHLAGMIAFITDAEPKFVEKLKIMYGEDTLNKLKRFKLPPWPNRPDKQAG